MATFTKGDCASDHATVGLQSAFDRALYGLHHVKSKQAACWPKCLLRFCPKRSRLLIRLVCRIIEGGTRTGLGRELHLPRSPSVKGSCSGIAHARVINGLAGERQYQRHLVKQVAPQPAGFWPMCRPIAADTKSTYPAAS